jgi:peptide/nickel transport system substrate-binding protein
MRRAFLSLVVATFATMAFSNPYVYPAGWTVTPVGDAQYGGVVVQGTISDPRTFNPVVSTETNDVTDQYSFNAQLLRQGPDSDEYFPYGAESFEISDDGRVMDFVIREGMLWSDGTPITVQDYYTSYLLSTDPETGANRYDYWFINDVQVTVEITGERSLRVRLPAPDRSSLFLMGTFWPVPDHVFGEAYRNGGPEAVNALWGTETPVDQLIFPGPWVLTSYQPGERLVWERNPYWGEWNHDAAGNPLPYLDGLIHRIGDEDALLNLFLAGELDAFAPRNLDDIGVINVAIMNGDLDATVIESYAPAGSNQFIVFNWNMTSNPFLERVFRSADFRRAMYHLVDRDTIIDLVYNGAAAPMHTGVYLPNAYWLDDSVPTYDYDPERAAELLARAGFSQRDGSGILVDEQGRRLSFRLATNAGNIAREQITQIFADSAREVGVDVQTEALDFNLLVDQLVSTGDDRPFHAILIGLTGGDRTWPFSESVYGCTGWLHSYNQAGECLTSQEVLMDELNKLGRTTLDTPAAREIGVEIQTLENELAPVLYTVSPELHIAWGNHVLGELPPELMSAWRPNRTRFLELTHVR